MVTQSARNLSAAEHSAARSAIPITFNFRATLLYFLFKHIPEMRFQHRIKENRKNLLMLIIENIKSVDEQYGPLFGRQILLSKSCLFVPRLPWPDRHFSLSIESTLCGLLVFVLFFCGPACIAQSKFSVFLTRPRNRPPFDLPGL